MPRLFDPGRFKTDHNGGYLKSFADNPWWAALFAA
jgi:hypothetical protein